MTLVLNKGQRNFILKCGTIEAGKVAHLEDSEAKKLAGMYPKEIEIVQPQPVAPKAPVAEIPAPEVKPAEVKEEKEEKVAPSKEKAPAKKGSKK